MPELLMLSLPITEVEARIKLPLDAATAEWCAAWRAQYPDIAESRCMLCDQIVPTPPRLLILPDYIEPQNRLLVPLCELCCNRPTMYKYGRALKMLKAMYKTRTGKNLNFHFTPPMQRHPR